jgi:hypothetical protein
MNPQKLLARATLLVLAAIPVAHAAPIKVNEIVQNAINNDPKARAAILGALGVKDSTWKITSVSVKALKPGSEARVSWPQDKLSFVSASGILNCEATGVREELTITKEVTNSVTVRKSDTLEVGAEVSVSAEYLGVGGSATGSTSYSMTSEREQTNQKTGTISKTREVTFNDKGGRVYVLNALKKESDSIAWSIKFTPGDDDGIEVSAAPANGGEICFYDGIKYEGKKRCFGPGNHSNFGAGWDGSAFSIKVPAGYSAELYQFADFKGQMHEIDGSDRATIGGSPLNAMAKAMIGSAKIKGPGKKATLTFRNIKSSLPEAARTFTVSGTLRIAQTDFPSGTINIYSLSAEQFEKACSDPGYNYLANFITPAPSQGAAALTARAPAARKIRVKQLTEAEAKALTANAKRIEQ